jgi:hypothetical protein
MLIRHKPSDSLSFGRASLAGFVGGYVMLLAGYWVQAVLGVSELDFAIAGLRYVSGGRQGGWFVGIIFHFIDSILLGLLFAALVYRRSRYLRRSYGPFWGSVVAGIAFAIGVWLILAMLIALPFMGAGPFGWKNGSPRPALASLGMHVIFGSLLGAITGYGET